MRKFLVLIAMLFLSYVSAQQFESTQSKGFDVESGTRSNLSVNIGGKDWEMFKTSKGTLYIKCVSAKSGKKYAVWIGEKQGIKHENKNVYKMKSGKYCIYKIGKSGNPYPVWLKEKQS